jgi:hypothetical protein
MESTPRWFQRLKFLNIDAETLVLLPGKYLAGYFRSQFNISIIRTNKQ